MHLYSLVLRALCQSGLLQTSFPMHPRCDAGATCEHIPRPTRAWRASGIAQLQVPGVHAVWSWRGLFGQTGITVPVRVARGLNSAWTQNGPVSVPPPTLHPHLGRYHSGCFSRSRERSLVRQAAWGSVILASWRASPLPAPRFPLCPRSQRCPLLGVL